VIRESLVKGGLAVYRCCLEVDDRAAMSLEIPQWMFDRAIRRSLRHLLKFKVHRLLLRGKFFLE